MASCSDDIAHHGAEVSKEQAHDPYSQCASRCAEGSSYVSGSRSDWRTLSARIITSRRQQLLRRRLYTARMRSPAESRRNGSTLRTSCDVNCDVTLSKGAFVSTFTRMDARSAKRCNSLNDITFIALGHWRRISRVTGFAPRTPRLARSRGPLAAAPLTRLTRCARSHRGVAHL